MAKMEYFPTGPIENFWEQISDLHQFRKKKKDWFKELTDREIELLTLVAEGKKNPAIARHLNISRATVQNHRARVRDKLNIRSQTDYIKYALAYDLISF